MIRAFIAVDLPAELRTALGEAQARLRRAPLGVRVTWSRTASLHLTLQFLGHVEESLVEQVASRLGEVAGRQAAFVVPVAGAGAFPDTRRPRVLWVGCADADGKLQALAGAVQAGMLEFGFVPEQRAFSAHLTLGRIKFPRPDVALTRALDSLKNQAFGLLPVTAVHLVQSQLHPEGSIYTKLSSHQLGDTHHAGQD